MPRKSDARRRKRALPRQTATPAPAPSFAGNTTLADLDYWLTPEEFSERHPKIASVAAIKRDICFREVNGLAQANALRKVGPRFLLDERVYVRWRFGEFQHEVRQPVRERLTDEV